MCSSLSLLSLVFVVVVVVFRRFRGREKENVFSTPESRVEVLSLQSDGERDERTNQQRFLKSGPDERKMFLCDMFRV